MSEIETTRKEDINWKIQNLVNEYCYCQEMEENNSGLGFTQCCNYCHIGVIAQNQLKLAQKEFLEFLNNWNWNEKCYMCKDHKESYEELKQNTEEPSSSDASKTTGLLRLGEKTE